MRYGDSRSSSAATRHPIASSSRLSPVNAPSASQVNLRQASAPNSLIIRMQENMLSRVAEPRSLVETLLARARTPAAPPATPRPPALFARKPPPVMTIEQAIVMESSNWPARITGAKDEAKLGAWFDINKAGANRHGTLYRTFSTTIGITATTVEVAAGALVTLLSHMHRNRNTVRCEWPDFVLPPGVLYCAVPASFQAFLFPQRQYILQVDFASLNLHEF